MVLRKKQLFGIFLIICGASAIFQFLNIIDGSSRFISTNIVVLKETKNDYVLGESPAHLIWFIQISDIHISKFHDKGRITDFQEFCNETVDVIRPSVVLASGDLTDAMNADDVSSTQHKREWEIYNSILQDNDISRKTVWLDVRGNHDNYDVPSIISINNYYQNFSIQGPHHDRSYMYSLHKGTDSVAFIAVDAAQLPGPRRPYNFIGILQPEELELLETYEKEGRNHNYTIWFGHYPTSCILSTKQNLTKMMEHSYVYLCGHLHDMRGRIPHLYTLQQSGSLELELADWKTKRFFRVAALDNGLFSFIDIKHGTWPVILITNPKDAQFLMNGKEPVSLIGNSSHIRVLVWSPGHIVKVSYKINSSKGWLPMVHIDGPLYTAQWMPQIFTDKMHIIEVKAEDSNGKKNMVRQPFSTVGETISFKLSARFLLMSNLPVVFQLMFGCIACLCIIPLCVVRIIHYCVIAKRRNDPRSELNFLLRKFLILTSVNKLFYSLLLSSIYVIIGPWFIGEILTGHIGVVFIWGIFVYGSYIPGTLSYLFGSIQMCTFHLPLLILAAIAVDSRYQLYMKRKVNVIWSILLHCLFALVIINQTENSYRFYTEYGTMSFLLGPLRTWSVFLGIYVWYSSTTLRRKDLRSVALLLDSNFSDDEAM